MSVEVVVPWRSGCEHRERSWKWLSERWAKTHPDFRINRCEALRGAQGGAWVKARAVMPGIEASGAEVVIVADADVWSDDFAGAVDAVRSGEAAWALPHKAVWRLSQAATDQLLAGADPVDLDLDERAYLGVRGGGAVVARREALLEVPLDPRFIGWGQEDHSWGMALHVLLGRPWISKAWLLHLWHPPQERFDRRFGSPAGRELWKRYGLAARLGPEAMRDLLKEAHDALTADQPTVLDHPAN